MNKTKFQFGVFYFTICCAFLFVACEKYLDEPSDKSLAIITTLDDLQALLDHHSTMNTTPNAQEISADNYYLTDDGWESLSAEQDQRMYIWALDNVFRQGSSGNNWIELYRRVYLSNTVLEELLAIDRVHTKETIWDNIKGQALVFRAASFLDAVEVWSVAYNSNTAQTDTGIPLRLESDFNIPSTRASVQQTYDQIITDLKEAIRLLPIRSVAPTRPSKPAAYGLLARTYLWMRDYPNAKLYADSCLIYANELMDYNQINASANLPIPSNNVEVVFTLRSSGGLVLTINRANVSLPIYLSFAEDDLRKIVFFRENSEGQMAFKGNYTGASTMFTGIATDEMYLIRAECYARDNQVVEAMQDLNTLLETRWRQGEFTPFTASSANEAVALILAERRKQLLFRGLRWMDIKRLNEEGANISLARTLKGETYRLPANSPRFALPLPDDLLGFFQ